MSILDDENILIENTKYGIDNPFYLLYNSFDNDELVYDVIGKLGANREYYKCYKLSPHRWLSNVQNANYVGKDGNIGAIAIGKFDGYLMISFSTLKHVRNVAGLLSCSGRFTFNISDYTLIYEP
jgi:hypothetical protein